MNMPTYEELISNPELLLAAERAAHRERSEAFGRLIVAPLTQLFKRMTQMSAPSLRTRSA